MIRRPRSSSARNGRSENANRSRVGDPTGADARAPARAGARAPDVPARPRRARAGAPGSTRRARPRALQTARAGPGAAGMFRAADLLAAGSSRRGRGRAALRRAGLGGGSPSATSTHTDQRRRTARAAAPDEELLGVPGLPDPASPPIKQRGLPTSAAASPLSSRRSSCSRPTKRQLDGSSVTPHLTLNQHEGAAAHRRRASAQTTRSARAGKP